MAIVVFDIGGTAVKYGLWRDDDLSHTDSFPRPDTWQEMKNHLVTVVENFKVEEDLAGVALSVPGAVDSTAGVIGGTSAVPYIHGFPIVSQLEEVFHLPVTIENDANCAALAEVWRGAAKDVANSLFLIIGSGIGGALVLNKELVKGPQLFGGEFGYMLMEGNQTLSRLASPVAVARKFGRDHLDGKKLSGKELFDLADAGNQEASAVIDKMYDYLARAIVNLAVSFNPDKVLIGGGISSREDLLSIVRAKVEDLREQVMAKGLVIEIETCQFNNQANLIGAVANFMSLKQK